MNDFIILVDPKLSEEEIARRIKANRISAPATKLFVSLVIGSSGNGATMREYRREGEALALAHIYLRDYEEAVKSAVQKCELSDEQKRLAYDIGLVSYWWGYNNPPKSTEEIRNHFKGLLNTLKESSEESNFDGIVDGIVRLACE